MSSRKSVLQWLGGCLALLLIATGVAHAQQAGSVTGLVTQQGTGAPIEGAQVVLEGTQFRGVTQSSGRFLILNVPAGTYTLRVQMIGYTDVERSVTVTAGQSATVNVAMQYDVISLNEIVVTGVAGATQKVKLPFTVDQLNAQEIPVPQVSAASAIQGKVAGATVISGSGRPGSSPTILLRGPTSINAAGRSQEPLYIVDGVILADGTGMADLDALDIENIEVVKGAAAASLYGSRAANGVVQITTKRGRGLDGDVVRYTVRSEFGRSSLPGRFNLTQRHQFAMTDDGKFIDNKGNPCEWLSCPSVKLAGQKALPGADADAWNTIQREAWPGKTYDHVADFFTEGAFMQHYVAAQGRSGGTNFHVSYTNVSEEGVMPGQEGFDRHNFRLNLDQTLGHNLTLSGTSFYSRSTQNGFPESQGNPLFRLSRMPAGVNLRACVDDPNKDCTGAGDRLNRLIIEPDPFNENDNPLYMLLNRQWTTERGRFMGSANLRWSPLDWFDMDANVSYDRLDYHEEDYYPKGYRDIRNSAGLRNGALYQYTDVTEGLNASITASFRANLGDWGTNRTQVRYLWEQEDYRWHWGDGYEFAVADVPTQGNLNQDNITASSGVQPTRSDGYFLITNFDLKDRYIIDALLRNDGSSLFGPNERRHWYHRLGLAWRVSQEDWFNVAGINEFKLRYSHGSAGGRPRWSAQYETYNVGSGIVSPVTLGNRDLRPEHSVEQEFGVDLVLFDRMTATVNYATTTTTDQILQVPQSPWKGFSSRWENAGTLESNTFEASLDLRVIERPNFSWTTRFIYDRTRQKITELSVPAYTTGVSGQGMDAVFYVREGEALGTFYGTQIATSCDHLPEGVSCDGFAINDDGFLVWVGDAGSPDKGWETYTDADGKTRYWWGTEGPEINGAKVMWGTPFKGLCVDRVSGEQTDYCELGRTTPDYKFSLMNTITWGNLSIYGLIDAVQGVSVYNQPLQWSVFEYYSGIMDQSGLPEEKQKPLGYYNALYGVSGLAPSSRFVEDGSFVKLRELSFRYRFSGEMLGSIPGLRAFDGITLHLVGRNLYTWTDYDGYDPEVGRGGGTTGSAALARVDGYNYPNFRTWTLGAELNF